MVGLLAFAPIDFQVLSSSGILHNVDKLRRCLRNEGTVRGWGTEGCAACVLCRVPLAISQTHKGAAVSRAIFVFHVFCLLGGWGMMIGINVVGEWVIAGLS